MKSLAIYFSNPKCYLEIHTWSNTKSSVLFKIIMLLYPVDFCVHRCMSMHREVNVEPQLLSTLFYETGSLTDSGPHQFDWFGCQQTLEILLSLPAQCQDYRHEDPAL